MMYFHTCASPSPSSSVLIDFGADPCLPLRATLIPPTDKTETPLSVDIVGDIRRLNDLSIKSKKAGMIILGGGVCKHQIANSMLFVRSNSPHYFSLPLCPLPHLLRLAVFSHSSPSSLY